MRVAGDQNCSGLLLGLTDSAVLLPHPFFSAFAASGHHSSRNNILEERVCVIIPPSIFKICLLELYAPSDVDISTSQNITFSATSVLGFTYCRLENKMRQRISPAELHLVVKFLTHDILTQFGSDFECLLIYISFISI